MSQLKVNSIIPTGGVPTGGGGGITQIVSATKSDTSSFSASTSSPSSLESIFPITITPTSSDQITFGIAVNNAHNISTLNIEFLDSPSTTSACKYYLKLDQMTGSSANYYIGRSDVDSNASSYARGFCQALLYEVSA
jgi:hypothetical protein